MRRYPLILLVCLFFLGVYSNASATQNFINVSIDQNSSQEQNVFSPANEKLTLKPASAFGQPFTFPPPKRSVKPIVKCSPPVPACPPPTCAPKCDTCCILPIRMPGQFDLATQVFWAQFSGTVRWPANANGFATTELDPASDLGLPKNNVLLEYSGRYQFRPRWALYYSIMPIYLEGNENLPRSIYYGYWFFPAGTRVNTKLDFLYQRVGLMYQPILTTDVQVSIFASWMYNDSKLRIKSSVCGGSAATIDRSRNMVMAGIELQKCIRTLPNRSTLSTDNRVGLGFLDGTFTVDAQAALRYSVPMGPFRWGYARGGYRWLNFNEDRNDLRLDTTFNGGFAELGIIF